MEVQDHGARIRRLAERVRDLEAAVVSIRSDLDRVGVMAGMRAFWTAQETAQHLEVSDRTLRRWAAQGKLTPIRWGHRSTLYKIEEVNAFMSSLGSPE